MDSGNTHLPEAILDSFKFKKLKKYEDWRTIKYQVKTITK